MSWATASEIDPDSCAVLGVDAIHGMYVGSGLTTRDPKNQCALDQPVLLVDRDGWVTLHRVMGLRRRDGERLVVVGPREPWPDGSIQARTSSTGTEG